MSFLGGAFGAFDQFGGYVRSLDKSSFEDIMKPSQNTSPAQGISQVFNSLSEGINIDVAPTVTAAASFVAGRAGASAFLSQDTTLQRQDISALQQNISENFDTMRTAAQMAMTGAVGAEAAGSAMGRFNTPTSGTADVAMAIADPTQGIFTILSQVRAEAGSANNAQLAEIMERTLVHLQQNADNPAFEILRDTPMMESVEALTAFMMGGPEDNPVFQALEMAVQALDLQDENRDYVAENQYINADGSLVAEVVEGGNTAALTEITGGDQLKAAVIATTGSVKGTDFQTFDETPLPARLAAYGEMGLNGIRSVNWNGNDAPSFGLDDIFEGLEELRPSPEFIAQIQPNSTPGMSA